MWEGLEGGKRRNCCNQIIISKIIKMLKINIFQKTKQTKPQNNKKEDCRDNPSFCVL